MKTIFLAIVTFGIVASSVQAGEYLQTLKEGCWVCETPQAYDLAVAEERKQNAGLEDLKQRLLEQKLCIYADSAFVARIMIPYAKVLERQDGKVKVTFTVQYRKRLEVLHRQISRVTFVGWTDPVNLLNKEIL